MKPSAAPAFFPYLPTTDPRHRTMAEVIEAEERARKSRQISRAKQFGYEETVG